MCKHKLRLDITTSLHPNSDQGDMFIHYSFSCSSRVHESLTKICFKYTADHKSFSVYMYQKEKDNKIII